MRRGWWSLVPTAVQVASVLAVLGWFFTGSSDASDTAIDWPFVAGVVATPVVLGVSFGAARVLRPWDHAPTGPARAVALWLHRVVGTLLFVALVMVVPVLLGALVFDPIG